MKQTEAREPNVSNLPPDEVASEGLRDVDSHAERELSPEDRLYRVLEEVIRAMEEERSQLREALDRQTEEIAELRRSVEGLVGQPVSTELQPADEPLVESGNDDEVADDDYSDLYMKDKNSRSRRLDGKFLSNHEEELIKANADLIRDNLPNLEEERTHHIEVEEDNSPGTKIEVSSTGRFLTPDEISNYQERVGSRLDDFAKESAPDAPSVENTPDQINQQPTDKEAEQAAAKAKEEAERAERQAEEAKAEAESREKAKKWYQKAGRDMFTPTYWAAKWTTNLTKLRESGEITSTMPIEEKEKILSRKRRNKILAVAAGAAAAGLGAFLLYKGLDGSSTSEVGAVDLGDLNVPDGSVESPATNELNMSDLYDNTVEVPEKPEASEAAIEFQPDVGYDVPKGSGGESLFSRLGIDGREWYDIQFDLLDKFPDSFYRMDDGNVGISQPGMLPQEVQEYINSLR